VLGLRWTLSTSNDRTTIGSPQATTFTSAEYGPSMPNCRANPIHASTPTSPGNGQDVTA
jgi:hypothetical protein